MNLLTFGNSKLTRAVAIFDLPAVICCPNHLQCARKCYARREDQYWHLYWVRMRRFEESKKGTFIDRIVAELQGKPFCRPHTAGDFYSQSYVDKWAEIMRQCPEVRFFGFTKTRRLFNFSKINRLSNVNIISSILPGGEVNFDLPLTLEILREKYGFPVCEAPRPYVHGYCMGTCQRCLSERYVLFDQH